MDQSRKATCDGKMRRRLRREYTWSTVSGSWLLAQEIRYVYSGNLVLQERDANNLPAVTYTRGPDLSGSTEGAGGIGGLLARTELSHLQSPHSYYHSDGNGNVTMLLDANQTTAARYHYDPFGNTLAKSGPLADANLYRFSSKELHPNSGLVYYLYRYYSPELQRWVNRDPLMDGCSMVYAIQGFSPDDIQDLRGDLQGEAFEGSNLYGYVGNDPNEHWDAFGTNKGGKPVIGGHKSVNCEGFTSKSCPADVKNAMDEAQKARNISRYKALRVLWKTMRRNNLFFLFLDFLELEMQQVYCPVVEA